MNAKINYEKVQNWVDEINNPELRDNTHIVDGLSRAKIRLLLIEVLSELCEWNKTYSNASESAKEARFWWNEIMDEQSIYEKNIGA